MSEQLSTTRIQRMTNIGRDTVQPRRRSLIVDLRKGWVTGPNGSYSLTQMECRLLRILTLVPGQVVPRIFLMKAVWELEWTTASKTLEFHIYSLHEKIEEDPLNPRYLVPVEGFGYRLVCG